MKKLLCIAILMGTIGLTACEDPTVNEIVEGGKDIASGVISSDSNATKAYTRAKQAIKSVLNCPSTASFPIYDASYVEKQGDGSYIVSGYVDAENLVGARVRNNYSVQIIFGEGNKFQYRILYMN